MRILTRPENSLANFGCQISTNKLRKALRRNSLANANGFANEIAKMSSSLRNLLANGSLRQNSLAIANAMAWCTQGGSACEGGIPWKGMRSSTLASTPSSTPSFRSTLPSTLPSYLLEFPVSLFCSRLPGLNHSELHI